MKRIVFAVSLTLLSVHVSAQTPSLLIPEGTSGIGNNSPGTNIKFNTSIETANNLDWGIYNDVTRNRFRINYNSFGNVELGEVLKVYNGFGSIDLGAQGADYAHIYTSLPSFAMNKSLRIINTDAVNGLPIGYINIGALNSSYAHFNTDRPLFYFDKTIQSTGGFSSYSNNDLKFQTGIINSTGTVTRMTIKNDNGYVGIGTENPTTSLELNNGTLMLSGESSLGQIAAYGARFVINTGTSYLHDFLVFKNIDQDGILQKRMSVDANGKLTCREIEVRATNWADYVFAKEYKLTPLNEVEKYIQENNHLSGIPSAQEVEANGINVAQMQTKMMEKIEELTLYIIQQQKEIEMLKNQK